MKNIISKFNKIQPHIFTILVLLTISIDLRYKPNNIMDSFRFYSNFIYVILYIALYAFFKKEQIKFEYKIFIPSIVLSISYIVTYYIHMYENIYNMFITKFQIFKTLIVLLGTTIIFYILVKYLFKMFETTVSKKSKNIVYNYIFEKRPLLSSFIIILLCYIPVIIIFYPGVLMSDGFDELRQYLHMNTYSLRYVNLIDPNVYINGHHSPFHTVMFGLIYKYGNKFVSKKMALCFVTIIQCIIQSYVLAKTMNLFKKLNVKPVMRWVTLAVYCFYPLFSINAVGLYKDILFSVMVLLYTILLIEIIYLKDIKKIRIIELIIASVLVFLMSNKGIYVVFLTSLLLIWEYRKDWKIIIVLIIPFITYTVYNKVILPYYHVTPGSIQETLSIPIQQVARYIVYYEKDITKDEKKSINRLLEYDKISEKYNPTISDPIKNELFNVNYTNDDVKSFLKVWIKLFFKHPGVYINAFANQINGYFFIEKKNNLVYYVTESGIHDSLFEQLLQTNNDQIEKTKEIVLTTRNLPILGLTYTVPFYVWLLLLMTYYILTKKYYRYLVILMPSIVIFLFCLLSPVSGNRRYIYPIVYCMPLLISWVITLNSKLVLDKERKDKNE